MAPLDLAYPEGRKLRALHFGALKDYYSWSGSGILWRRGA